MVIGSGPIVIGQACEFDYSGTQACKVLRREGFRVVARELEPGHDHDRPASSPTAPTSSRSRRSRCSRSCERERPDALLPTLGGQTALNVARRARRVGRPRPARRRADRRVAGGDPPGGGSQRVQGRDAGGGARRAARRHRDARSRRRSRSASDRLPADRAAVVHPRRRRQRVRRRPGGARGPGGAHRSRSRRSRRSWSRSRSPDGRSSSSR